MNAFTKQEWYCQEHGDDYVLVCDVHFYDGRILRVWGEIPKRTLDGVPGHLRDIVFATLIGSFQRSIDEAIKPPVPEGVECHPKFRRAAK